MDERERCPTGWVSVGERLPDDGVGVLVWRDLGLRQDDNDPLQWDVAWLDCDVTPPQWVIQGEVVEDIKYWMPIQPLPSAPSRVAPKEYDPDLVDGEGNPVEVGVIPLLSSGKQFNEFVTKWEQKNGSAHHRPYTFAIDYASSVAPKNEFDKECVRCGVKVRTAWTTCHRCHKPLCSLSCEEWHLEKDACWEGSVAEQPQPKVLAVGLSSIPRTYCAKCGKDMTGMCGMYHAKREKWYCGAACASSEQPSREQAVEGLVATLRNLCVAYRRNVPSIMSTDGTWAPVLDAERALAHYEASRGERQ